MMSIAHIRFIKADETHETVNYNVESPDFNVQANWTPMGVLHLHKSSRRQKFLIDDHFEHGAQIISEKPNNNARFAAVAKDASYLELCLAYIEAFGNLFLEKNYFPEQYPKLFFDEPVSK